MRHFLILACSLSEGFGKLDNLKELNLAGCEKLEQLPDSKLLLITPTPDMRDRVPYLEIGLTVPCLLPEGFGKQTGNS